MEQCLAKEENPFSRCRVIFVHGYNSSPERDWYPRISTQLEQHDADFEVLSLPGGEKPKFSLWFELIDRAVSDSEKPVILVGHSLGTRAVLLYLEKSGRAVEQVFLFAAFDNDPEDYARYREICPDFFSREINIYAIRSLARRGFTVVHSRDDPNIPFSHAEKIVKSLGSCAELIPFEGRGHLYEPQNAELVFNILREKLKP